MSAPETTDQRVPQERLQALAAAIFARHGADIAAGRRAGGWTNFVWLTDELALRLATRVGSESLRREARLAAVLPPDAGYPPLVAAGTTDGLAWTLAARLPGGGLGDAWDGLGWEERAAALRGLWRRAEAVHRAPAAEAARLVGRQAWFNITDPAAAERSLARLAAEGILAPAERTALGEALERFWRAVPAAPLVLCHGDLTLDNAMWHAGEVTALLDFEFALMAPAQLDLNHLVKCAFGPGPDTPGTRRLREVVAALARPHLARPGERDLLLGYAALLELWLLELWLAHPEGEGPLDQWEPLRRLRSLGDGRAGYLAPLLDG